MTDAPLYPDSARGFDPSSSARFATRVALGAGVVAVFMIVFRSNSFGLFSPEVLVNVVAACGYLSCAAIAHFGRWRFASLLLVITGALALLSQAVLVGGLHAETMAYMAFPAWMTAYLLGSRTAVLVAAVCIVAIAAVAVLDISGRLGPDSEIGTIPRMVTAMSSVLLGLLVGWAEERRWHASELVIRRSSARTAAMLDALPDAFLLIDGLGEVQEVRVGGTSALTPLRELLGAPLATFVHGGREVLNERLAQIRHGGEPSTLEVVLTIPGHPKLDLEARFARHPEGDVIALVRDIAQRRRTMRMRDEFVATVSHELRTPLTSIHGSLGLLRAGALGDLPSDAEDVVELASRNSERLCRIVDDLLDVQKMESGRLELLRKPMRVQALLQGSVEENRPFASRYDVSLTHEGDVGDTRVHVDRGRIEQVLSNLVSNAVKHSPVGSAVELRAEVVGGEVRISVADHGRGIPEGFRPRVFDTFAQADSSDARAVSGTGLGLAICRRLVHAHGGEIGFETEECEGTTFWFRLPVYGD